MKYKINNNKIVIHNENKKPIFFSNSRNMWEKRDWDHNNSRVYYENSDGAKRNQW